MPEGLSEKQIQAEQSSSNLFDALVDNALAGSPVGVEVSWGEEADESGGTFMSLKVRINGQPAQDYSRRLMEWSTTDEELITATSKAFEEKVGSMWSDTIRYYDELRLLDEQLGVMVVPSEESGPDSAVWYNKALDEMLASGVTRNLDDVVDHAKTLACLALVEWAEAVDAQAGKGINNGESQPHVPADSDQTSDTQPTTGIPGWARE